MRPPVNWHVWEAMWGHFLICFGDEPHIEGPYGGVSMSRCDRRSLLLYAVGFRIKVRDIFRHYSYYLPYAAPKRRLISRNLLRCVPKVFKVWKQTTCYAVEVDSHWADDRSHSVTSGTYVTSRACFEALCFEGNEPLKNWWCAQRQWLLHMNVQRCVNIYSYVFLNSKYDQK